MDIHRLFHFFNTIFSPEIAHTISHKKLTKPEFCLVALLNVAWHLFIVCSPFCYPSIHFYPSWTHGSRARARPKQSGTTTCDVLSGCCTKATPACCCTLCVLCCSCNSPLVCLFAADVFYQNTGSYKLISWNYFNCWLASSHSSTSYTTLPTGCNGWWIKS